MRQEKAKQVLRALTEIDDTYLEEAENFHSSKICPLRAAQAAAGLAAACLVLFVAVPQFLHRPVVQEGGGAIVQGGNPWQEVKTLAEALTGFSMKLPEAKEPYSAQSISVLDEQMISVAYTTSDQSEVGYTIRKAKGTENPSGDSAIYEESKELTIDGETVTLRGEQGNMRTAAWTRDGYAYSISTEAAVLTEKELLSLVREVR